MAGSTQAELETLFEDIVLASDRTDSGTDPSNTLVTTFINQAIRKITRELRPQELMTSTATTADITINTNVVTVPSTLLLPLMVYYKDSSGSYREVLQKNIKAVAQTNGIDSFLTSTKTGNPTFYYKQGDKLVFDVFFGRTETAAISIWGLNTPTTLATSSSTTQTELSVDYDLLIIYEAAILFYQRDEDRENQEKFERLAITERNNLQLMLQTGSDLVIEMDPYTFPQTNRSINKPGTLFEGS